ncbi:hypothetical protein DFR29_101407 [Tahibacter aquaticus]|uniref:Uncharacterized protein n=1 Tax=Tahibacter aquaticus TaxID=520092 RepID=A0A4R6ZA31_9GAMM|nr:exosortase H-associated membrane protein [Tahibacter aquaticus]TDR48783.1 hypothetical protein DFR29_101407 [Tahibacter aquaticus]
MKLSPLKRFLLQALAWLPACFFLWWWVSGLTVKLPVWLAGQVLSTLWPDLVASVSQGFDNAGMPTMDILTKVAVSQPGPDGVLATGYLEPTIHPLIYGYSLPLFFGLCLATPQEEERRWGQMILGCLAIWLAQAFGLVADSLKVLALNSGPETAAAVLAAGLNVNAIALCYQFGYLILPTVVPAALWLALNRPFIEALTGRKFGEPGSSKAGRSAAS